MQNMILNCFEVILLYILDNNVNYSNAYQLNLFRIHNDVMDC